MHAIYYWMPIQYIFIIGHLGAMKYLSDFELMPYFAHCLFILNVILNVSGRTSASLRSACLLHTGCVISVICQKCFFFSFNVFSLLNR